ncbi:MAG: tryptophan synthase subunit alpha [Rhodospirillaceae bacterium]
MGVERIERRFAALRTQGRAGLVTFITAGDPDRATTDALLAGLPAAGADVIELGMPFSDPMADGPAIQAASLRALAHGHRMADTLAAVRAFRTRDTDTPVVLMGYYNPIMAFGVERFVAAAADAGVDGLIVVDLPPEEDAELRVPAATQGIAQIRLVAPTTGDDRLPGTVADARGFLYYVSVVGITGTKAAAADDIAPAIARIRGASALPVAVGFGVRTPDQARAIARTGDAVVVGTAIVERIAAGIGADGRAAPGLVRGVLDFVARLADGVRGRGESP